MAAKTPVVARPAAPPRVGLLVSARTPQTTERWETGFRFQPEGCGDAGIADPCAVGTRTPPANAAERSFEPYLVWAAERCSAFGFQARDWEARARRALEACEGAQIEAELWTGALAQSSGWDNAYLASESSDVITAGATAEADALAAMEQALAGCSCGTQAMIHAPRNVVSLWHAGGTLRREGNLLLTINDTIVVPGAGYDGSSPVGVAAADGSVWVYGTGMVEVRRSDIEVVPGSLAEARSDDNTIEIFAQRLAAASWDGCCHFAAEVDAPMPDLAGPGS